MRIFTNLRDKYYDIKSGVKNLITFFLVVWKFRNWDSHYTLSVLRVCLLQLKKDQDLDIHEGASACSKQIGTAIKAIDIILEGGKIPSLHKKHEETYGEFEWKFSPSDREGYSKMDFTYSKVKDDPVLYKQASEEKTQIYLKEEKRIDLLSDEALIFTIIIIR